MIRNFTPERPVRRFALALALLFAVAMAVLAPLPHHHTSADAALHCPACVAHAAAGHAIVADTPDSAVTLVRLSGVDSEPVLPAASREPLTISCRGPPSPA